MSRQLRLDTGARVSLGRKDFLAQGGQGAIYVRGDRAYKVYADPGQVLPASKLAELAAIGDPRVIRPLELLRDGKGHPVGYAMRYVKDAYRLCELVPRAFRERHGITPAMSLQLTQELRDAVIEVHRANVLVVDLNELNVLVDDRFAGVHLIDVDSYQTRSHPATALMDSVRDRHMQPGCFTTGTDWFSFAVVSFQLLVGIHPYKGKHPQIQGLEQRMQHNVSVLSPQVRLPPSCYPLTVLPRAWRDWYEGVLEGGERVPPPRAVGGSVIVPALPAPRRGPHLIANRLFDGHGTIRGLWERGGRVVIVTSEGAWLDGHQVSTGAGSIQQVAFTAGHGWPVAAGLDGGQLWLQRLDTGAPIPVHIAADGITTCGPRLYVKCGPRILEIELRELGDRILAGTRLAANVLEHGARLYDGVALQPLFATTWVALFPQTGTTHQLHLPELDGRQVVAARFEPPVLMVLAVTNGVYQRLVFRFAADYRSWDVRQHDDVGPQVLSFAVLDNGTVVTVDDDALELFAARIGRTEVRRIDDPSIGSDLGLFSHGGRLVCARGEVVDRLTLA